MQENNGIQQDPEKVGPLATMKKVTSPLVTAALWTADTLIKLFLRTRQGERIIQPTKRVTIPASTKQKLFQNQDRKCSICGKRRTVKKLQVEHILPLVRGGTNDFWNLQLACGPCNTRKGIQTNQEFYERYQRIASPNLLKTPPEPPTQEIPQSAFRDETQRTVTNQSVQEFKRTKYITGKTKINGGSLTTGGISGGAWFIAIPLTFGELGELLSNIALFGAITIAAAVYLGLILRAKHTGMYEQ